MAYEFMRSFAAGPLILTSEERALARRSLADTAGHLQRQYEAGLASGAGRPANPAHIWRRLHLHDEAAGELVNVERNTGARGRVSRAMIELILMEPGGGTTERHIYGFSELDTPPSRDVGRADLMYEEPASGAPPAGLVDAIELAGLHTYLTQKAAAGLYVPISAVQAMRLEGLIL